MLSKRVVVTGLGALTPIGNDLNSYWHSLVKGINGADKITYFNTTNFKTNFACQIKNYNPYSFFSKKEIRKIDPCSQYGLISVKEAILNSYLNLYKENIERIGVVWGSGVGGLLNFENEIILYANNIGNPKFNPFFIPKMIIDNTAGLISIKYGLKGPNYATASACASSANAIVDSYYLICLDKADVMITGGSEAAITQSGVGGFNALHALSRRNHDPNTASRPFEKNRDGFVLGEGAGCLILEDYKHAKNRGANIYGEIIGVGMSSDAYHITTPHPDGAGIVLAMQIAINDAKINPCEIEYINTHGTSTILGDLAEIKALKKVFGNNLYDINMNSTKSMTGHLLGAACAIESIATILTLNKKVIPPTTNLFYLDESIDSKLNFTPNNAQNRDVNIGMCNAFGFGGHNVSIIYKKYIE